MKLVITFIEGLTLSASILLGAILLAGKPRSTADYSALFTVLPAILLIFLILIASIAVGNKRDRLAPIFELADILFFLILGILVGLELLELYTGMFGYYI